MAEIEKYISANRIKEMISDFIDGEIWESVCGSPDAEKKVLFDFIVEKILDSTPRKSE